MYRGNREFILDIKNACERILDYIKGCKKEDFFRNTLLQDAVVRNIEILGEAVKSITEDFKEKHNKVRWKDIAKTRDKIIHFYFGVDYDIVWDIITNDIPVLLKEIESIIKIYGWQE